MKRVELWHHQVRNYVPKNEAGILLFNSLKGELEEELEDADISNIYNENGVKFITDAVKKAVETRSVHVKRKLLADYEHIYRNPQEGMRSYINRYQRTERALNTVEINVEKMYDKEARGARLLERSKLSHEHQRQVLIGSMQSLDFDTIKDVLMFQWPDHRAPPPPPAGQQQRPAMRPGNSASGGKGKGSGKSGPRRQVMATENVKEETAEPAENDDEPNDEDGPEQEQCDDGEMDEQQQYGDEDTNDDVFDMNDPEIAEIFTITAKKLAGVMQARKYGTPSNMPKRSIADRKKTTTCSACGIQGYWAGDPECQVSAKGHSKGKGDKDTGKKPNKSVHFMNYHGGPDDDDDMPLEHEAHQIFVMKSMVGCNNQVRLADAKKASGYLILDTACQRLCAGKGWSDAHSAELKTWSVVPIIRDTNEVFEFGKGHPLQATHRLLFPAALGEVCIVIAPCILDAHIPCLASRTWLTDVGAVIDLGKHVVHFTKFNTSMNLQIVNGHVGINIADFTNMPQALQLWNVFRDECLKEGNQHMHKEYINLTPLASQRTQADAASAESFISQFAVPHGDRPSLTSDMDDQLARPGGKGHALGTTRPKVSEDTYDLDLDDGINRTTRDKGAQDVMPAPLHQAKRKSPRQLRAVPRMQSPVEVRQGERRMGATHKVLWFLTVATAFLHNCVGQLMDKPNGFDQEGTLKAFEELRVPSFDLQGQGSTQEPSQVQGQSSHADHRREPMEGLGIDQIRRPGGGTGRTGHAESRPVRLRLGRARQLSGQLERSSQVLEAELQAYDKLPAAVNLPKIDIMELYAGHADISFLAHQYDLKALEPYDLMYGHDMTKDKYKRSWRRAQKQFSPLLVVVETECTHWNIFNENLNYAGKDRLHELEALREDQLPLVREGVQSCLRQIADGNFFLYENPEKSRIWDLPEVQELASRDDVYVIKCHAGAYGACNSNGDPILKTYQWITNSEEIAAAVSKKMTPAEQEQCVPLIGKEVRLSARYPIKLCRAILKALRIEARRRWPQRFVKTVEVLYQEPVQDPAAWSKVLNDIHRVFNSTSSKTLTLADYDPIHQQVADLVPWELTKVQIVRTPIQRRLPREFFFTHRGAILEYQDGQIVVEAEALDGLHFPKQRFSKAVAYGCFWYGYGEPRPDTTSSQPQSTDAQPQPSSSNPPTQRPTTSTSKISTITFPGCPAEVPQEVKSAVTRLHLNLGHPSEKELFRLLAWQGAVSKHMITAVKHMVCASCSRSKPPLQPRPSAMPTANIGQFNDALQSDVFYCRDVLGINHAILGIVDQSTLLHQAARLPDLSSETTLKLFRDLWFKPYGFPQTIRVDPGGNFALNFRNYVERHGIFLEVIPAEAHWRIGLVERRNSVLRDILERIIDAESIMDVNDFDQALDGAVHAINSMTYTHGRPPYMAVFGQIPRVASGLLQDDMSLITHPVQQGRIRPDILRAEAMRALADINTSQALRRALLRKTATTNQKDLLPGQSCAYWRWQIPKGRGTKKKGAWIVARFLSYDPDGRSAWLHSGTTTIQVSLEQLRGAFGFEHWQPTREDQQALKDAAASIRQDIWQDHRSTAPPPDEDQYDYALEHEIDVVPEQQQQPATGPDAVVYPLAPPSTPKQPRQSTSAPATPRHRSRSHNVRTQTTPRHSTQQLHVHQQINQQRQDTTQLHTSNIHLHSYPASPTAQPVTPFDYHPQRFGLTRSARSRTPTNRRIRAKSTDTSNPPTAAAQPQHTTHAEPSSFPQLQDQLPLEQGTSTVQQQPFSEQRQPDLPLQLPLDQQPQDEIYEPPPLPRSTQQQQYFPPESSLYHNSDSDTPVFSATSPLDDEQPTGIQPPLTQPASSQPAITPTTTQHPTSSTSQHNITDTTQQAATNIAEPPVPLETIDLTDEPAPLEPETPTLPQLPQKRPYEAMLAHNHNHIEPPPWSWDGSPETIAIDNMECTHFAQCALPALQQEGHAVLLTDLTGQQSESDAESSDPEDQKMDPLERLQSRKEAKALEREVPWRSILRLPPDQINDYVKSNQKEETGWQKWGSIEPVPDDEANAILADPQKKRRVLRSRACYRNKSRDPTKLIAKTRVVALGHLDPDLYKVARDAPTPSRTSEYLLLSIFIAGANQLMQNSLVKWILWAGDVSTAFLQGAFDENERTEPLYLLPPRDQITLMAKTFMSKLYKVKSNIYGLANALRTWFLEVVRRMKSINYLQHSLDHLLFYKIEAGERVSVCIVYVDDFLLTCRETYNKSELLDLFTWGSQKQLSLEQPLEFKGKELTLKKTKDDKLHLHVTQTKFINNTEKGKVQKGRIAQGPPLTTAEETEFRSVTGSLQWLASQTRPDIAAWVSLSSRGKETGPAELAQLYETLEFCKLTPEHGLVFQDVAINNATTLVGYADSSWANAAQCASQQGSLVLITTPHCTEVVTKGNLVDWKSNRSARVCRSTLAAEAIACDDCVDRTFYANAMLSELLSGVKAHKNPTGWRLHQLQVTDCKSLYDAVAAENPRTTEKRTYVDIRSIQEYINPKTIHWVPTTVQWADGLTKCSKALRSVFFEWIAKPFIQLSANDHEKKNSSVSVSRHSEQNNP